MVNIPKERIILPLIFIAVLGIHLHLAKDVGVLPYDSYFHLRQAEHIQTSGLPLYTDPLSYLGRVFLFPPLLEYITALVGIFTDIQLAAILTMSISYASIAVATFLISNQLTKSRNISLLCAFFAGFSPVFYQQPGLVTTGVLSTAIIFFLSYAVLKLDEPGFAQLAVVLSILALLSSPIVVLLLVGILLYFVLLVIEREKPNQKEVELTVFLLFLSLWFYVLLYKKAFVNNSLRVPWSNLPSQVMSEYFININFADLLYVIGIVPLLLGVYAVYNITFDIENRQAGLFIGLLISTFVALWLRLIPYYDGIMILSISLILLSSHAMKVISLRISRMKSSWLASLLFMLVFFVFSMTSFLPFMQGSAAEATKDVSAFVWISENTSENSTVLAMPDEGFAVSYFAKRRNVADANFLFVKNAQQIYDEIEQMYTLRLTSETIRLLNKYEVDYIYFSAQTKARLNQTELYYADSDCFEKAYGSSRSGDTIYRLKGCRI